MHPVLRQLYADHRDLRSLMSLVSHQRSLLADPLAPNIGLLVDAMLYLTSFPDVRHHPLEDQLAKRLVQRRAIRPDMLRKLEGQHERLARQGVDLLRDLEGAAREELVSRELVEANIRLYVRRLGRNMQLEELSIFPAAAGCLSEDDWGIIAAAREMALPDPLFDSQTQERFAQLRAAIELEAVAIDAGGREKAGDVSR